MMIYVELNPINLFFECVITLDYYSLLTVFTGSLRAATAFNFFPSLLQKMSIQWPL